MPLRTLYNMAQNKPLVQKLLASSYTAATKAGKIIRDIMSAGELGIVEKGINDLQTEADRSAQCCIISNLTREFPKVTIIGEEGQSQCDLPSDWVVPDGDAEILGKQCPEEYLNVKDEDIVVWVDPLDGTSEYTQGLLDHVTVLIGLSVKGRAVGGIIHQPYYNYKSVKNTEGRTMWGLVGMGVGGFTPLDAPKDKLIITTTRSHNSPVVVQTLEALKPDEVVRVGGAGHKVLLVLEGQAHAYLYPSSGCKKWDTCAPEGILEAAGGKLVDVHGDHYDYHKEVEHPNTRGILATNRTVDNAALLKKIPESVVSKFPKKQKV
ncbi:unnamed protein product [Brassicogethes aeneus]|uniref:3'(2'),5'-bisphosphate nucleotidase 1 n=1 Tax=Brassicogethes aeneus TaxID=1431903 RepID=A0A9P0B0E0_BRAAE|nr:unnamed protein product [Brassicogethes aeneus]